MKFLCERCGTRYSIADEKVRQKILKIRCKSCDNVITLRDSAVADGAAPVAAAVSAPNAAVKAAPPSRASAPSLPAAPRPPAAPERPEWHMAVDGQQTGPFNKTQLCSRILAQLPDAEVYVWKDGMDGWKEPPTVPEIERALAQAKLGRSVPGLPRPPAPPPPKTPAAPGVHVQRPSAAKASLAPAAKADHGADFAPSFDEGEATQIQPLSAAFVADLGGTGGLGADGDKTPGVTVASAEAAAKAAKGVNGQAKPAAIGAAVAPRSADALGSSAPFFPPPASEASPDAKVGPAPLAPYMSAGESGLSKVMGLGGRFSRKPALKYGAAAVAVLGVVAVIILALTGSSTPAGQSGAGNRSGSKTEKGGPRSPEDVERAAQAEAAKWFQEEQAAPPKTAQVGASGGEARVVAKRATGGGRGGGGREDPTSPPALAPPPATFQGGAPPEERKVADFPLGERRAIANKKAAPSGAAVDQSAIRGVVTRKENQDAVKLCYNRVLRQTGARTGGRIEVVVNIGISGRVKDVHLTSPAALDMVHQCLKTTIARWRFPASGDEYATGFTLVLSGS